MENQKQNRSRLGGVSNDRSYAGSQNQSDIKEKEQQLLKDDIYIFLPGIDDDEYRLRSQLRTLRNCASAAIANTDSETARTLAWTCSDYVTAYVYAGVDKHTLSEVGRFCHRLMVTAMNAESIDDGGAA